MNRLRALAIGSSTLVVVLALLSVLVPGLVELVLPSVLVPPPAARSDTATTVLPAVGAVAVLVALVAAVRSRDRPTADPLVVRPPERGETTGFETVGYEFEQTVQHAADRRLTFLPRNRKEHELLERLRSAAIDVYAIETGASREAAEHAIATGAWTEDRVAAWVLADRGEIRPPLSVWLRDRLLPKRSLRQQVRRTAAAIEELQGDRR